MAGFEAALRLKRFATFLASLYTTLKIVRETFNLSVTAFIHAS